MKDIYFTKKEDSSIVVKLAIISFSLLFFLGIIFIFLAFVGSPFKPKESSHRPEPELISLNNTDYNYEIENGEIILCKYLGNETDVIVPENIDNMPVTTIANSCYAQTDIVSVSFTNEITKIEDYAFYKCQKLKEVNLNRGLKSIGDFAFKGCAALTEIKLPKSLEFVNLGAFMDCTELKEIDIQSTNLNIGQFAFSNCGVGSMALPSGVKSVGKRAFEKCPNLKALVIGPEVTTEKDITKDSGRKRYNYNSNRKDTAKEDTAKYTVPATQETTIAQSTEITTEPNTSSRRNIFEWKIFDWLRN